MHRTIYHNPADSMLEFKEHGFITDEIETADPNHPALTEIKENWLSGKFTDQELHAALEAVAFTQ